MTFPNNDFNLWGKKLDMPCPSGTDGGLSRVPRASDLRPGPADGQRCATAARGKTGNERRTKQEVRTKACSCSPQLDGDDIRSKFRQKWRELEKVLDRQRSRGGVIDPEEESNRFLIHINEVMCRICRNPVEAKNLL